MGLSRAVKHGIGRLTASADTSITRLTQVSHKAPTRLLPLGKSSVDKAGAAVCALSNYGGGMLQGDTSSLYIDVEENARLGVMTQGASRIYTQRVPNECRAFLEATVHKDALFVLAPDPCSLFASSSFAQKQSFQIHPESSVVLIDWFSSGRYRNGEYWDFDKLSSRTSLTWLGDNESTTPFLQDSVSMDLRIRQTNDMDPLGVYGFHAFASLILYGKDTNSVKSQIQSLQDALAAESTRIRERQEKSDHGIDPKKLQLSGKVCMGMSQVVLEDSPHDAYVVRFAATTNEDLYRVFHHCLLPLGDSFGMEFYKERIQAKASEIPRSTVNGHINGTPENKFKDKLPETRIPETPSFEPSNTARDTRGNRFWAAYMLADSSMPTGSFAHSSGLEAAAQLGIIGNEEELQTFIQAATRSTMQVMTPFLIEGHNLALKTIDTNEIVDGEEWILLEQQMQSILSSNAPACAASLDQGKSLARVASQWLKEEGIEKSKFPAFDHCNHVAPIMGAVGALLGLDETQVAHLFGYCIARDMVSAAVRLSLVGPLASVKLLDRVQWSAEDGWKASLISMKENGKDSPLAAAAASAPIIEAIHPCHDLLQTRLFRS